MATARRRERWDHTSALAATILNARQGLKRHQLVDALKLHPLRDDPADAVEVLHGEEARDAIRGAFGS